MKLNANRLGIELHIHLDGSFRPSTVFEFAKKKSIRLPADNAEDFEKHLIIQNPNSLNAFLKTFEYINPPIQGDKEAITQITFDFLEDCVNKGNLCYVEPRFSPHLLASDSLSPEEVVKTVLHALEAGGKKYDIESRAILCMMRHQPSWSDEVVRLATSYESHGVCAVDLAGDDKPCDGHNTAKEIKLAFKKAHQNGVHCVAHAGENGCAASVTEAVNEMFAERIGHGYHILDDPVVYKSMRDKNIHFEICPLSSRLTGSVTLDWPQHPIHQFINDDVNFSINTDDPTVTGQWLRKEYALCMDKLGLSPSQIIKANFRAADACFLNDVEKDVLRKHLMKGIGIGIRD